MAPSAPDDAAYILTSSNLLLPNRRLIAVNAPLTMNDGGPAGNLTLGFDPTVVSHNDLDDLAVADPHTQYMLAALLTANGDLLTRVAGAPAPLAIGSGGEYLGITSGLPDWKALPGNSYILNHVDATVDVNNTAAETDVFNFTIPGGTMAVGDALELQLPADFRTASSTNRNYRLRVYLGGTLYYDSTTGNFNITTRTVSNFTLWLHNRVTANDQILRINQYQGQFGTLPAVGEGTLGSNPSQAAMLGFPAKNMANNQAYRVTMTWSAAENNTSFRFFNAVLIHHRSQ